MWRGGRAGAGEYYVVALKESEEARLLSRKFVRAFVIGTIALALVILVARLCGCHFPPTPPDPETF